MDIRQLKSLVMIRQCGNMAEAAQRLHLTQSALSHQLKAMESHYGSALFIRKSRPLRFTDIGLRLLELADRVLPLMESAEHDINRLLAGETGRLHIVIECHSCFDWLMPTMDRYRDDWPDIEMDLSLGFSFEPLPALLNGDIDLVITSDPVDHKAINYYPLFQYQSVLLIDKSHPLADKKFIAAKDLLNEILITYPVDRNRLDVFQRYLHPANIEPAEVRTSELTSMIVQLVANKRGVAVLPSWAITKHIDDETILSRQLNQDGFWGTLYAAIRSEQHDAPYMEAFLECARTISAQTLNDIKPNIDTGET